jgi:hypothetical protein
MDRGPMALFGAIIAVGLGPALWLGAQFGTMPAAPAAPPTAVTVQGNEQKAPGRAGAAPEDPTVVLRTDPRSQTLPITTRPTPRPSATTRSSGPVSKAPTTPSSAATTPSTTAAPSSPGTESTAEPSGTPTGSGPGDPPATGQPSDTDPGGVTAGLSTV